MAELDAIGGEKVMISLRLVYLSIMTSVQIVKHGINCIFFFYRCIKLANVSILGNRFRSWMWRNGGPTTGERVGAMEGLTAVSVMVETG